MSADRPVFIGGLDRSGKTPLRIILDASREIGFTRRTYLWTEFFGRYGDLHDEANLAACIDGLARHPTLLELGVEMDPIERQLRVGDRSYERLFGLVMAAAVARTGKPRWGDQEALVESRAEAIFTAFPEARIIHLVRDPRDRHFDLQTRRGVRPGLLGISVARWAASVALAARNAQRHPGRYLVIRYEDLVAAPAATVGAIGAFIGEPDVERLVRHARTWAESARHTVGAALTGLDRAQLRFIERRLGVPMRDLGYDPLAAPLSPDAWLRYALLVWPINTVTSTVWLNGDQGGPPTRRSRKVMLRQEEL